MISIMKCYRREEGSNPGGGTWKANMLSHYTARYRLVHFGKVFGVFNFLLSVVINTLTFMKKYYTNDEVSCR